MPFPDLGLPGFFRGNLLRPFRGNLLRPFRGNLLRPFRGYFLRPFRGYFPGLFPDFFLRPQLRQFFLRFKRPALDRFLIPISGGGVIGGNAPAVAIEVAQNRLRRRLFSFRRFFEPVVSLAVIPGRSPADQIIYSQIDPGVFVAFVSGRFKIIERRAVVLSYAFAVLIHQTQSVDRLGIFFGGRVAEPAESVVIIFQIITRVPHQRNGFNMTRTGRGGNVFQSQVRVSLLAAEPVQIVAADFVAGLWVIVFRGQFEPIGG